MANHETPPRLDSWKAIAAYLGRDVSTVIRWEREKGLPVHRLPGGKRQAVFAVTEEIDAWMTGQPADEPGMPPASDRSRPSPIAGQARWLAVGAVVLGGVAVATWAYVSGRASAGSERVAGALPPGFKPAEAGTPGFARMDIPQYSVYSAAAGDLNKDGALDLVVTAYRANLIHVYLGAGDGTFRHASESATGMKPDGVALGDFNGDGWIDVGVANRGSNTMSVHPGNGDGTLRSRTDYPAGTGPRGVTAGDFDGDGSADLIVTNADADSITAQFFGREAARSSAIPVTGGPYQVRAADFNADGILDLAVGNTNHVPPAGLKTKVGQTLTILLAKGDGSFAGRARYSLGQGTSGIAAADFNRDGHLDLAVTSFEDHVCYVLPGNGDGTFGNPATVPTGAAPLDVAAGDVDGDGTIDLVIANAHAKTVSLVRGHRGGTFAARVDFPVNSYPKSVLLGDLNADRALDIVVTNFLDNSISVLLNTGARPAQK
jgi:hypothetical protein